VILSVFRRKKKILSVIGWTFHPITSYHILSHSIFFLMLLGVGAMIILNDYISS
jgi:hypothetical protein